MKLPSQILTLRDSYVSVRPLWSMPAGPEADERARHWTVGFAKQSVFSFPELNFGSKRADPGRPISKDSIAQEQPDGKLFSWDLLSGAGSGSPTLVLNPESSNITGQIFVPVEALNVIGNSPSPPNPPSPSPNNERDYPGDEFGTIIGDILFEDYLVARQDPNSGMGVWFLRTVYDYLTGMSLDESIKKHRKEWRKILGLID